MKFLEKITEELIVLNYMAGIAALWFWRCLYACRACNLSAVKMDSLPLLYDF